MAGYLVYFALGATALTFLIRRDIYATISVIIVAGACGIAAGTPLAILGGIGRSARLGAIVKGGVHLETLGHVDTVVLDKTGTLTFGRPEVQQFVPVAGIAGDELLDAAATAELRGADSHQVKAEKGSVRLLPSGGSLARTKSPTIVSAKREYSRKQLETFGCSPPKFGELGR
jgi:P-type E1-E2 ATPase